MFLYCASPNFYYFYIFTILLICLSFLLIQDSQPPQSVPNAVFIHVRGDIICCFQHLFTGITHSNAGFLNMFDHAGNAFVSAYRYYKDKECRTVDVHIEYIATPDLSKKTLLIVDPMLATGESMELAWKAFVTKGMPAKLQIACVIASRQGVEHLEKLFPGDEVTLWCAAIDPEMNEHSYIVPGLGDAGDLAFGDKI